MATCTCALEGGTRCFTQHTHVLTIMAFLKRENNRTKDRKGIMTNLNTQINVKD